MSSALWSRREWSLRRASLSGPALAPSQKTDQRVVLSVYDPFLHRDDPVVGDLDVLGAYLGAAFRDVAVPKPPRTREGPLAVEGVVRVHVELGVPDEEAGTGEVRLVFLVVADHM